MSAPSEPEKYSIDEMMERLKNRSAEEAAHDGELVTRRDGSQALRVRKRKRRSLQPHKEEHGHLRARMIQVSAALILLLLGVFTAGAAIVFANSSPFRDGLCRKISLSSGAHVELEQFRMNPTSANAARLTLKWPDGNALRDLSLRGIRSEIFPASFFGKSMVGEETSAEEATLTLRVPQAGQRRREEPASEGMLPIRFKHYAIPKLHVLIGDPTAPLIRMKNSEATFNQANPNGRPQLLLNRGDISIQGWPKLRMDRSHIEFRGTEVDIIGMRLQHESDTRGVFELSGTISPYATDRSSALAVHLESYNLAGIAGTQLGRLFSGRIDTLHSAKSNYLSFHTGPDAAPTLAVSFRNSLTSSFEINGSPFLFGLAQSLEDEWFECPAFTSDGIGVLRREHGKVTIGDLGFENKGRMALRGAVTMASDQRLSGDLDVGIAEAMIKSSKNRRLDAMFGPPREGFRWLTLKIGGTAAAPTDNFRELFESAKNAEPAAPTQEIPSFEELTNPK